ncbi:MAG: two-component system NtrC family response regulator PilR [Syntrophaceae bacterium]|nr:MAG: two-component system NtrC family response regulator PilR [Syntrophaceae bacterium]
MNKANTQDKDCIPEKYKIIGVSKHIQSLREKIKKASENDGHVLITGPTGTGKELVARNIHYNKKKDGDKFVGVNCGAISPNLFESEFFGIEGNVATGVTKRDGHIKNAEGGTLFLDEIGELAKDGQAKLLRFLDDKIYMTVGGKNEITAKIKIIAATNRDLEAEMKKGKFRADLFYRLAEQIITTEPIAGKIGDIICLINHFMKIKDKNNEKIKLPLYFYDFPGNVRELETLVGKDIDEIIGIMEKWSEKSDNENDPEIKRQQTDAIEMLSEGITIIGKNQGVDVETDDYEEWFGDLSNYGFSDDDRKTLEVIINNQATEVITTFIKKYKADDKFVLGNMLLAKRHSAIIKRDDDIIDRRMKFYEIAVLAQDYKCSKREISDYLHIGDKELSPDKFKQTYHFEYPGNIKYKVKTPIDVFPEPEIEEPDE